MIIKTVKKSVVALKIDESLADSSQFIPISFNLLDFADELKIRRVNNGHEVWDPVRKKFVKLEPEEFVRQLLISKLHQDLHVGYGRIISEKQIPNYQLNRFDLGIRTIQGEWSLLAECKSFHQQLNHDVLVQVMKYNADLKAKYILITNGHETYIWKSGPDSTCISKESDLVGLF